LCGGKIGERIEIALRHAFVSATRAVIALTGGGQHLSALLGIGEEEQHALVDPQIGSRQKDVAEFAIRASAPQKIRGGVRIERRVLVGGKRAKHLRFRAPRKSRRRRASRLLRRPMATASANDPHSARSASFPPSILSAVAKSAAATSGALSRSFSMTPGGASGCGPRYFATTTALGISAWGINCSASSSFWRTSTRGCLRLRYELIGDDAKQDRLDVQPPSFPSATSPSSPENMSFVIPRVHNATLRIYRELVDALLTLHAPY
jgi:hypothetical protein